MTGYKQCRGARVGQQGGPKPCVLLKSYFSSIAHIPPKTKFRCFCYSHDSFPESRRGGSSEAIENIWFVSVIFIINHFPLEFPFSFRVSFTPRAQETCINFLQVRNIYLGLHTLFSYKQVSNLLSGSFSMAFKIIPQTVRHLSNNKLSGPFGKFEEGK